jgi:hypothetical protein
VQHARDEEKLAKLVTLIDEMAQSFRKTFNQLCNQREDLHGRKVILEAFGKALGDCVRDEAELAFAVNCAAEAYEEYQAMFDDFDDELDEQTTVASPPS